MANVNEVRAALVSAEDETDRGVTDVLGSLDLLDRAITRLRSAATGSAQPGVHEALAHLETAKSLLRDALKLANTALTSSRDYRATM
jgi:hypothetical protein